MDVLLFIHGPECLTFKKDFLRSRRGCYSACRTAECLRTVLSEGSISEVWKTSASSPHGPSLTESSACRTEHTQTQRPLWVLLRNRDLSCTPVIYRPVCMMDRLWKKRDSASLLPFTVENWSQNIPVTAVADTVVRRPSLHSSNPGVRNRSPLGPWEIPLV